MGELFSFEDFKVGIIIILAFLNVCANSSKSFDQSNRLKANAFHHVYTML